MTDPTSNLSSWQTEDYDAMELYTRATDKQGHKDTVHVGMPPYLLHRASAFVSSAKVLGYTSVQDLMRDALVHRMHYWAESLPPKDKIAWKTTAAMLRAQARIAEMDAIDALAAVLRDGMERAVRAEQVPALEDGIEDCETHARDMVEAGQEGVKVFDDLATEMRLELGRIKARRARH